MLTAPLLLLLATTVTAPQPVTLRPAGDEGVDVLVGGRLVAPLRLSTNGVLTAGRVERLGDGYRLTGLRCKDPQAVEFAPEDYVEVSGGTTTAATAREPELRFHLTLRRFDAARWQALFPGGAAPFHFLTCAVPTAKVWHHRGWLNATPNADPFPLLQDVHVNTPEISCPWNRNWSYLCPVGGHPIPVIGAWDPDRRFYLGYDFQDARSTDQSERYVATAYCWQQDAAKSFISLAYPFGGLRYTEQVYPKAGDVVAARCRLILDLDLPDTEDPNERFQARLFARHADSLPLVPARNDLAWIPGQQRLKDFMAPIGMGIFGGGGETTFYGADTVLAHGWTGHREMPLDTAARRGDTAAIEAARQKLRTFVDKYGKHVTLGGEDCLFWETPLEGSWKPNWGGAPVRTLHDTTPWFGARLLVELYRYDRARGQARAEDLQAIEQVFNWTKHFVWTRNEFADVPSSPFAIGGTLSTAFLLDYYFTFQDDPARRDRAAQALELANRVLWRYLAIWAMDSDRGDGNLDGAFLLEPNSGRDWAALACANEVHWLLDSMTQVYVHTGDPRLRYYLRGTLQRWPMLYRPVYGDSLDPLGHDAMTEGLGFFDGAGPGRGGRYNYGAADSLPLNEPVGNSRLRVVAGARSAITFTKGDTASDIADYRTDGRGGCAFRIVSSLGEPFDVSFSYPMVDVSKLPVRLTRGGQTSELTGDAVRRPEQGPSSLYLAGLRDGDQVTIGTAPAGPAVAITAPRTFTTAAAPRTEGGFVPFRLPLDTPLKQDWRDTGSFAGLIPGERWAYGVPYWQGESGASKPIAVDAGRASMLFVAYAPTGVDGLAAGPSLVLDNGQTLALAGKPVAAWQAWPPIFQRQIVLDRAAIPAGRSVRRIDPRGHLLMAVTAWRGAPAEPAAAVAALDAAAAGFAQQEQQKAALRALRAKFSSVPAGKIAVVPPVTNGAAPSFLQRTGLVDKLVLIKPDQLIDPAMFNATRYPVALCLDGESYLKTIRQEGDGKAALLRYLGEGGTLVLLTSQPFPLLYGDGPGNKKGPGDSVLAAAGVPLRNAFETPPAPLHLVGEKNPTILTSLPSSFPYPPGDPRLRMVVRNQVDPADRHLPLLAVRDEAGKDLGDAAFLIELGHGPAKGGKVLYVWSTLLSSPLGDSILADVMTWVTTKGLNR